MSKELINKILEEIGLESIMYEADEGQMENRINLQGQRERIIIE